MMGGDPSLTKHLHAAEKKKFWTRVTVAGNEQVRVLLASSIEQIQQQFPELEVFQPGSDWEAEHQGQLFREYDVEKNHDELLQSMTSET